MNLYVPEINAVRGSRVVRIYFQGNIEISLLSLISEETNSRGRGREREREIPSFFSLSLSPFILSSARALAPARVSFLDSHQFLPSKLLCRRAPQVDFRKRRSIG